MKITCKNCGETAGDKFCSHCGQSTHTDRINIHDIVHDFLHGILHVDSGILYTIKELAIRPGKTIRNYLAGKRVRYFKPLAYFFILATVFVFLSHMIDIPVIDTNQMFDGISVDVEENGVAKHEAAIMAEQKAIAQIVGMLEWVKDHYAISSLVLLPFMSFITFVVYRKSKYNYGEHLVINSYLSGSQILVSILLLPIAYFSYKNSSFIGIQMFGLLQSLTQIVVMAYILINVFDSYSIWKRLWYLFLTLLILVATTSILMFLFGAFVGMQSALAL